MSWILLVIALFLDPAQPPQPYVVVLAPGVKCDEQIAVSYVNHLTNGAGADFAFSCDEAPSPGTSAAPSPNKHIPGDTEAYYIRPKV